MKFDEAPKAKRQAAAYDDTAWTTMALPQYIEDAGLQIDGVIWFRRDFNFSTTASTYVSLGPIDDSDIVYINGTQVGLTEKEYAKNRYYDIPVGVLNRGKNTIAIRVEGYRWWRWGLWRTRTNVHSIRKDNGFFGR